MLCKVLKIWNEKLGSCLRKYLFNSVGLRVDSAAVVQFSWDCVEISK